MKVKVYIGRFCYQYGFWEYIPCPKTVTVTRITKRGNLVIEFGLVEFIFDKVSGKCVNFNNRKIYIKIGD